MKKLLILGAGGQIARRVIDMLANNSKIEMDLFLRHPAKIKRNAPKSAHVVQGNVLNMEQFEARDRRPRYCLCQSHRKRH